MNASPPQNPSVESRTTGRLGFFFWGGSMSKEIIMVKWGHKYETLVPLNLCPIWVSYCEVRSETFGFLFLFLFLVTTKSLYEVIVRGYTLISPKCPLDTDPTPSKNTSSSRNYGKAISVIYHTHSIWLCQLKTIQTVYIILIATIYSK